ncbi:hypothetical protein [Pseudomonas sp. CFBP 8772]|uniref:hypothetical protein n=1 Tax=Pseudomonas sp. CFBP 8772 TaxID=2775284 RepID=UPI00177BE990|nr:hypothetical protein [Pseudomonas sp. CFBP 8772]MBD8598984.1 hypothetical protein [Pseudomonas sp. CFBP 8772]
MPTVKGRSTGQVAKLQAMMDWHLDMATELERAGKFDHARIHLIRANLLKPAATSSLPEMPSLSADVPFAAF